MMNTSGPVTRTARPVLGALVGVLAAAVVVGLVVVLVQVYALTSAIRSQQKESAKTNERISSCTDPEGDCYKESQERTSQVVADIGKVSAYAAACADEAGVQDAADVYACVLERLAQERKKTS